MPTHRKVDSSIQDVLTRAGGKNPFGAPRFRIIWGWDRLTLIGGEWVDYDENGIYLRTVAELRDFPKYHPYSDFFYIEKWCRPEMYGRRGLWEATTYETTDGRRLPALGPFPEQGDYECSWRVALTKCPLHANLDECLPACTCKQYYEAIEPTITVMEQYVARVLRSEVASDYERLKAIEREQEAEQKNIERIQKDILGDSNQLFTGSYVAVPKHYDAMLDNWRKERVKEREEVIQ